MSGSPGVLHRKTRRVMNSIGDTRPWHKTRTLVFGGSDNQQLKDLWEQTVDDPPTQCMPREVHKADRSVGKRGAGRPMR